MGHATVSVLSGLILEKVYEFFFSAGFCIKRESVKRGSTVPQLLILAYSS